MFPVCAPDIAHGIRKPADILRYPLLRDTYCPNDWEIWLKAAGVDAPVSSRSHSFSLFSMVIQAATKGLGICMAHGVLVQGELAAGSLVELFDLRVPAPASYYIVTPVSMVPNPAVARFSQWLVSEAHAP
jgi:LysR family transcriptional regulator, glycine cleavage system transcriptional activator